MYDDGSGWFVIGYIVKWHVGWVGLSIVNWAHEHVSK